MTGTGHIEVVSWNAAAFKGSTRAQGTLQYSMAVQGPFKGSSDPASFGVAVGVGVVSWLCQL